MKFQVIIELKKEVLDPEGRAIKESLGRLGFDALQSVDVSKRYVLEIDDAVSDPEETARKIASEYLSNPVAETYTLERV